MPELIRKWNYRNISLTDPPCSTETVGVFLKDGRVKQMPWRGFISAEDAKAANGIPVRLEIHAVISSDRIGAPRVELKPGEFPQGAVIDGKVYGVLEADGTPRILKT